MPYIQCDDGQTYSRYDMSNYVKKCIKDDNLKHDLRYETCMKNPICKKDYESKNNFIIFGAVIIVVILISSVILLFKSVDDI